MVIYNLVFIEFLDKNITYKRLNDGYWYQNMSETMKKQRKANKLVRNMSYDTWWFPEEIGGPLEGAWEF